MLPTKDLAQFEGLFQALENQSQDLGIESYGVSLTTLEDVFLKIGEELGHHKKEEAPQAKGELGNNEPNTVNRDAENQVIANENEVELEKIREKNPSKVFWMHFNALVKKRFIYFKRDVKGLICEIVLPIIIIWLGLAVTKIQIIREAETASYTPALFDFPTNEIWVNTAAGGVDDFVSKIPTADTTIVKKTAASLQAFDTLLKDTPEPNRLMSIFVENVDTGANTYDYALFTNSTAPDSLHVGLIAADNAVLKLATGNDDSHIKVNVLPLPLTD